MQDVQQVEMKAKEEMEVAAMEEREQCQAKTVMPTQVAVVVDRETKDMELMHQDQVGQVWSY